MTVVKINALSVTEDSGDELVRRFAARVGAVNTERGFEGFELLRPTDGRNRWLVVTRWQDEGTVRGLGHVACLRSRPCRLRSGRQLRTDHWLLVRMVVV